MQRLFEFLSSHWDTMVGLAGTVTGVAGWLAERNKRMLDRRDSDMAFYLRTIDAQNGQIEKLRKDLDELEEKYQRKIEELEKKLAQYENLTHTK